MSDSDQSASSLPQILSSDLEVIDYFIRGKKKSIDTANLQIEYDPNAIKLLDRQGNIVGVSKQINEWQQKVFLDRLSFYLTALQEKLNQAGFLLISKTNHPDFVEYHKYQIPRGYRLNYRPANLLGRAWLDHQVKAVGNQANIILIFQSNNWYPVQELNIGLQTMRLRTLVGELIAGNEDLLIWIEQIPPSSTESGTLATTQTKPKSGDDLTETPPVFPFPQPLNPDMTISIDDHPKSSGSDLTASFKTPVITSGHSDALDNLKKAIKIKALNKLVDYLNEGEKIVSTEVLKNGHDQIISTKTTEVKRGCPRWVVEQVKKF